MTKYCRWSHSLGNGTTRRLEDMMMHKEAKGRLRGREGRHTEARNRRTEAKSRYGDQGRHTEVKSWHTGQGGHTEDRREGPRMATKGR